MIAKAKARILVARYEKFNSAIEAAKPAQEQLEAGKLLIEIMREVDVWMYAENFITNYLAMLSEIAQEDST